MRIRDWSSDLCSSDLALVLVELVDQVVDDALVEVLAAEEGVAVGRQHLELLLAVDVGDLDDRHVEGAAAQVVHGDLAVAAFLVQAVGQRSEEHTSELQSLMRISYAVFCLKKNTNHPNTHLRNNTDKKQY